MNNTHSRIPIDHEQWRMCYDSVDVGLYKEARFLWGTFFHNYGEMVINKTKN